MGSCWRLSFQPCFCVPPLPVSSLRLLTSPGTELQECGGSGTVRGGGVGDSWWWRGRFVLVGVRLLPDHYCLVWQLFKADSFLSWFWSFNSCIQVCGPFRVNFCVWYKVRVSGFSFFPFPPKSRTQTLSCPAPSAEPAVPPH